MTNNTNNGQLQLARTFASGYSGTIYFRDVMLFDLTDLFGSGNEPTTYAEARQRILQKYHIDIANYVPYGTQMVIERCNIWHDLPKAYQRVEWIESHGTEYVDSEYKGNLNTEVEIKVKQLDDTTGSTITPFGNNVIADNVITINLSTINSTRNSRFGDKVIAKGGVALNQDLLIKTNKSGLWINGVKQGDFGATSNFETDNLWVCQCRNLAPSTYNDCDMRLYYCKILENGILIRNFVPCYRKSDNVIGLYDTINDKFYTNQGTGTFGKGADVN